MIKNSIKLILQKLLGFERYLYIFSLFIIKKLPWDKNEKDFLFFLNMVPNKGIILDIGSNIGVMSYYLSKHKPASQIISFEPLSTNYNNHLRIIKKFNLDNNRIETCALGDENGELEMVMPVVNSVKMHGLSHVVHNSIKEYNEGNKFTVPVRKLDNLSFITDADLISGIKIDVENFEYFVLKGAEDLIKKHKPIIYAELWPGENRTNTFDLLTKIGYQIKVVDHQQLADFNQQNTQNFIFIFQS